MVFILITSDLEHLPLAATSRFRALYSSCSMGHSQIFCCLNLLLPMCACCSSNSTRIHFYS
jgi:hypothetical protein